MRETTVAATLRPRWRAGFDGAREFRSRTAPAAASPQDGHVVVERPAGQEEADGVVFAAQSRRQLYLDLVAA
jgi:hypothetical protein